MVDLAERVAADEVPPGYRMTELGALPGEWQVVPLGDVCTLQRGNDLPKDRRKEGTYPVVGSNGVTGTHAGFVAGAPGVVVGRSGSVGKVTWVDRPYWPLNTALWVKDFHGNDERFVYYLLSSMDLSTYAAGASVPTLNRNLVHPIPVALPPLPEQRAIAHVLSTVQRSREATEAVIAATRELKCSAMRHLFTYGKVSVGTTGQVQTEVVEDGRVPSHWRIILLGELCRFVSGDKDSNEAVPYGAYPFFTCGREVLRSDTYSFDQEAIILAGNNAQGKFPVHHYSGMFESRQRTYIISVLDNKVLAYRYLFYEVNRLLDSLRLQSVGSTTKFITAATLRQLPLRVPPVNEQMAIAETLQAIDSKLKSERQRADLLQVLSHCLGTALLSGQVTV